MSKIELKRIRKSYGSTETIAGIDLHIENGEFVVFVGPSGCGKSTLLRMIAGLEEISSGDLWIGDQNVTDLAPAKRGVAMVFQSYALYPHMTVYENMAFGLSLQGTDKTEITQRVLLAAKVLQLETLLERKPKELSGGQRQRVAIGRAIVRNPKVFLFDEPLSNLDASLRVQMRIEIARLHSELKATMVYVTHDQVEAMTLADRIVVINKGKIEQVGSPLELYHHPKSKFVATFIGSPKMNLLKVNFTGEGVDLNDGTQIQIPQKNMSIKTGDALELGIRPEHIELTNLSHGALEGRVEVIEYLGNETFAHLDVGSNASELIVARLDSQTTVEKNQLLYLKLPVDRLHLFDKAGQNLLMARAD